MSGSPTPGTPQTATKSWVATALTFAATFGMFYVGDDDPFTRKEMVEGLISAGVLSGVIGGLTWAVPNKRKV